MATPPDNGGRRPLSRRQVVRAAVWTAPIVAIAAAAPAYAASPCPEVTARWTSAGTGQWPAITAGGVTVSSSGSGDTGTSGNGVKSTTTLGGANSMLLLKSSTVFFGSTSQTVTLTFSSAVRGLSFTILDIDTNSFVETDAVTASGGTFTAVVGSAVTQSGNTFTGNANVADTNTSGNVTLSWTSDVTTVTIAFTVSAGYGSGSVGISDLSFRPLLC